MAREALLYGNSINWALLLIVFAISIILASIGIKIIYKNENTYVKMI